MTRESKQTNEKLLRTFLKRQAIKAALGDSRYKLKHTCIIFIQQTQHDLLVMICLIFWLCLVTAVRR